MTQIEDIYNRILDRTLSILNDSRSKLLTRGKLENIVLSPEENICAGLYVNNSEMYNMSDLDIEKSFRHNRYILHSGTLINHNFIYDEYDVFAIDDLIGANLGNDRFDGDAMDLLIYRMCCDMEVHKNKLFNIPCGNYFLVYPSADVNFSLKRKIASLSHLSIEDYFKMMNGDFLSH